jgi:hypothetical protein
MRNRTIAAVMMALLAAALPAAAQYEIGGIDLIKLTGILGAGYNGAYGNQEISNHSLAMNGSASLNGFYYNPNFLSFNLTPYLNESRANSNYRSVENSSGFAFSSGIFTGSHFAGSINYTRDYNKSGNFALPGVPDVTTHGNGDNLGINWGVNLPDLPNVSIFFNRSASSASLYGTNEMTNAFSENVGLRSVYNLDGFQLTSTYNHIDSHSELPAFLESQAESSSSSGDSYSFGVSHKLPFNGSAAVGYNHSDFSADSAGYTTSGSVNNAFGNVTLTPTDRLGLSGNMNYIDNLAASLDQLLLASGVPTPLYNSSASHSLDTNFLATYKLPHNIVADGMMGRREQSFLGETYTSTMIGGGFNAATSFRGGTLSGLVRLADFRNGAVGTSPASSSFSLTAGTNYTRDLGQWRLTGNFNYSQNQQTLLVAYTTSFYTYGATANHPIWKLRWAGTFAGTHSGIVQQAGTASSSQSYSMTLFSRYITGSAAYSSSNGSGVLTPAGIAPSPVPSLTPMLLFGGKSYNYSLGSTPIRRLILSASYSVAHGNTTQPDLVSTYHTKSLNALVQYRFRQIGFTGGFSRLQQGFSLSGTMPFDGSTFFVGINRWFDFF